MPLFQDMLDTSAQPLWKHCLDVAVNVNGLSLKNLAIHSYIIISSSGCKKNMGVIPPVNPFSTVSSTSVNEHGKWLLLLYYLHTIVEHAGANMIMNVN